MAKFKPIFTLLLGVGVATTAYAATVPASSASHRDTGVGTGAEYDATAILAQFSNREELSPLADTQAETQLQDFFSRYGQCPAPSRTCNDYICLQGTPHCQPYSAEEQRETIEKTKNVLLDLISTVKCYPIPKGVDGCDDEGYCDVFKTRDLTDCKCRTLRKEEYAVALANHPDFAPHLEEDENEEEPPRRKLQRRSENPAFNPDKVEADPVFETNVEELREIGLGQIGTCDVESRTCAKDHICKLGTAKCRPFEAGKRIRFTETFIALEQKLIETGKCHRSSHNKDWCNQYGFCDASEYRDDCRALEYWDDEKATNFLILDDGKWVWPYEVQGKKNDDELETGTAKGNKPTHMYEHRDGDVDLTQYPTQPQQPAEHTDDQVQNFSSYLVTITEQPDMLEALYQVANVHDQQSMFQIREQLIRLSHNKKATRKLLKSSSKRARATKAELFAQEPTLYGRITKRSTDSGLKTVTFDPTFADPTPNPTSEEVCAFMEVADNIHSDLTMVYALARVLGIESIGGVRTFWKQLDTWAADEKEAFKALKRGKLAAMLLESKSIPGASLSS
ncbi:hypothetical protein NDA13_004047 [Ustilago tritici]|nr:hypothetical protein NDA13_004047 [Ustilago tritici]